jgi:HEAT repeat protein
VPVLIECLDSHEPNLRTAAVAALGSSFRAAAKPAVPKILKCLSDADLGVRWQATNALRAIDPEAAAKAGVK